jgi:hypothetical protein
MAKYGSAGLNSAHAFLIESLNRQVQRNGVLFFHKARTP